MNTGIDKLTEKSQVSEDGTMRSLEPESSQPPPEGNLPAAVSDGEPWSGVRPDTLVCREGLGCEMNSNGRLRRRGLVGLLKKSIILEAICTRALC